MDGITFGQLLAANWLLLTIIVAGLVALGLTLVVRRRRNFRRLPATIKGVRIECHGAVLDEDFVMARNWRITLLMTNVTRRPAAVPVLTSRAVIMAGRKQYAGTVYLEREARGLNPGDRLVAWVLVRLGGGEVPHRLEVELNGSMRVTGVLPTSTETVLSAYPGTAA